MLAHAQRATERSFEKLYKRHVHAVYRYALAVLHNEADAEDVTQTTFLNAYRAFQRGERPHRPHNWLIKIAHNTCRQRFRDSSRRPQEVEFDETLAPAATQDTDVPTAGEIRRALGFLAFNQRAALVMRELEGRSYAEIAQVLDLSDGAVETLIFRARRALREQLEGGLTCEEAGLTLSRLEERKLSSSERGALRAHLRECKDCAVLERRQRAQRAALKSLGAAPLPGSLAGSFFGGSAAVAGMGIGAKLAAVLAAGLVATGAAREAVQAVQASNTPAPSRPAATRDNATSSSVSTRGRVDANAVATRRKKSSRKAERRRTNRFSGTSKSMHGIAATRPGTTPTGGAQGEGSATVSAVPQLPIVTPPAIQVPPVPQVPVEVPPVQVPPVQVPPLPVPVPPLPVPPPPPLP